MQDNMNKLQNNHGERKKLEYIQYVSFDRKFQTMQTSLQQQEADLWHLGIGAGVAEQTWIAKRHNETFRGSGNVQYFDCGDGFTYTHLSNSTLSM